MVSSKKNVDRLEKLRCDVQHDIGLIAREIEQLNSKVDFLLETQCHRIYDENKNRGMIQ